MGRKLDTYKAESGKGKCEVHFDYKTERGYIKYFDSNDKMFYTEHFPNNSIRYIQDAAENWCLGIKKLEKEYI
tara:strand:- start:1311 stop:1529 length:219 start_codon:yes stop_codon:yes gene_type:complete